MKRMFRVGLTRDFLDASGKLAFTDVGLELLAANPAVEYSFFDRHEPVVTADQLRGFDAVITMTPKYTPESFQGVEDLTALVKFGVGYDSVNVPACTAANVLLSVSAGAANHSVAEATIAWMLALTHRVIAKDQLVRERRWSERAKYMGCELRDRTLGIIGLGGIGKTLVQMIRGFGMQPPIAYDPFVSQPGAAALGVTLVSLERLMRDSDFISVNCPLNEQTRNLIGRDQLTLMKPTAFLIHTARGGVVNEQALLEILKWRRIAGAGIDVFESELTDQPNPFAELDNVILAPHCIAWTDELFRDIGRIACQSVCSLASGAIPSGVVNREVLEREEFKSKLAQFKPS